jgi:hypothetical protein
MKYDINTVTLISLQLSSNVQIAINEALFDVLRQTEPPLFRNSFVLL